MSSSLSLQRSLYAYQRRQIASLVQPASPAFRAYEARYHRATRGFRAALAWEQVVERVLAHDVVHVGDYHTLRQAQQAYAELAGAAVRAGGRRVVLALEFVEASRQAAVDAFLAGRLSEAAFLRAIGRAPGGEFDLWPGFRPVFELARRHRLQVVAIDRRAGGANSLARRDRFAAARVARAAAASDRPLVLVLMGQFHVAPAHLPRQVARALGPVARRQLTVYQNAEGVWWRLARSGLAQETRAVELDQGQVCLLSASPVECQRSFLDYVEAEAGDAPLEEPGVARSLRLMARELGRLTGVRVGAAVDALEVVTVADLERLDQLARRSRYGPAGRRELQRQVLAQESAFFPRARVVWLGSRSLNHAAEEATHLVRWLAVGPALERPRPRREAYLARCYELGLGFFGSRLLNPARRSLSLAEWSLEAAEPASPQREVALQLLALLGALLAPEGRAPLPLPRSAAGAEAAARAVGAVLGEGLARAHAQGQLDRGAVRALFLDRLDSPAASLRALARRLQLRLPQRATGRAA